MIGTLTQVTVVFNDGTIADHQVSGPPPIVKDGALTLTTRHEGVYITYCYPLVSIKVASWEAA